MHAVPNLLITSLRIDIQSIYYPIRYYDVYTHSVALQTELTPVSFNYNKTDRHEGASQLAANILCVCMCVCACPCPCASYIKLHQHNMCMLCYFNSSTLVVLVCSNTRQHQITEAWHRSTTVQHEY